MYIHRLMFDAEGPHFGCLRTRDAALAARWAREAPANAQKHGHQKTPVVLDFEPSAGDEHGNEIVRAAHRLQVDFTRNGDGSVDVRGIYHYPDKEADDDSGPHPLRPMLTKRQAAKIPAAIAKTFRVITPELP